MPSTALVGWLKNAMRGYQQQTPKEAMITFSQAEKEGTQKATERKKERKEVEVHRNNLIYAASVCVCVCVLLDVQPYSLSEVSIQPHAVYESTGCVQSAQLDCSWLGLHADMA